MNEIRRERDKMKRAKERKQKKDVAPTCLSCIEQTGADGSSTVPLWEGQQTPACETKKIAFCWSQQNDWGGDREVEFLIKNTSVLQSPVYKIRK